MSHNSNSQQKPWWSRNKAAGLDARIASIQKINDPTTYTDEVLTGSKFLILLLLLFSGLLGSISYFKFFSESFPFEAALFMAGALTFVIEWGKNRCATWALRIPFFQGFRDIFYTTPAKTFIWIGLVLIAVATFGMSIYNSTIGGKQLSLMLSHERHQSTFQPDTKAIDGQIAATQNSINANREITWKGTVTYQAQKAIQTESKSLEPLQRSREEQIRQQRSDWEKQQAFQADKSNFSAKSVLLSGGWIELVYLLCIFVRVACEKNLDGRRAPTPIEQNPSKNNSAPQYSPSHATSAPPSESKNGTYNAYRPAGFNVGADGNVIVAPPPPAMYHSVPQCTTIGGNEIIQSSQNKIRADVANLRSGNGHAFTVSNRIYNAINAVAKAMEGAGFEPDKEIASKFYVYMAGEAFPTLREHNRAYEFEQPFKTALVKHTDPNIISRLVKETAA